MKIVNLRANGVRNLKPFDLKPHPHINLIVGENGSGKTSLLETIFILSTGKSFRESHNQQIIQKNADEFVIFLVLEQHQLTKNIGMQKKSQGRIVAKLNGEKITQISDLTIHLPLQLIHPESLRLIDGGPSHKRKFINWGAFHHYKNFSHVWREFQRALKQRNAALHQKQSDQMVKLWDEAFIECSIQINQMQQEYVLNLSPFIQDFFQKLMGPWHIQMDFDYGWDKSQTLKEQLDQSLLKDRKLQYTSIGPQRADLKLKVDEVEVNRWCSRGQQKLLSAALLFAQQQYLKETGKECVLLVDDLPAELDKSNRSKFLDLVRNNLCQTFLTATSEKLIPNQYAERIFCIKDGVVECST